MSYRKHVITIEALKELDALYEETEDMGALGRRPVHWGTLVEELRKIRRIVEAGVTVKVEGEEGGWRRGRVFMNGRTGVTTRLRTGTTVGSATTTHKGKRLSLIDKEENDD